jgi:Domain of unknown function (DUF4277)
MRPSYRPELPPQPQSYHTQVLDHVGLVAGMFEELGIAEVIDHATQQDPAMRTVTAGHAVKAMVLNGLGFLNQQLYLVLPFFPGVIFRSSLHQLRRISALLKSSFGNTLYHYSPSMRVFLTRRSLH